MFTDEELDAALEHELPYLMGYPQPMIREPFWKVANGKGTEEDKRMLAAIHAIWKLFVDDAIPPD
jgi:hypothetical protein